MKCIHTFGTGRHKRPVDIALLFEYITYKQPQETFRSFLRNCHFSEISISLDIHRLRRHIQTSCSFSVGQTRVQLYVNLMFQFPEWLFAHRLYLVTSKVEMKTEDEIS